MSPHRKVAETLKIVYCSLPKSVFLFFNHVLSVLRCDTAARRRLPTVRLELVCAKRNKVRTSSERRRAAAGGGGTAPRAEQENVLPRRINLSQATSSAAVTYRPKPVAFNYALHKQFEALILSSHHNYVF